MAAQALPNTDIAGFFRPDTGPTCLWSFVRRVRCRVRARGSNGRIGSSAAPIQNGLQNTHIYTQLSQLPLFSLGRLSFGGAEDAQRGAELPVLPSSWKETNKRPLLLKNSGSGQDFSVRGHGEWQPSIRLSGPSDRERDGLKIGLKTNPPRQRMVSRCHAGIRSRLQ